MGKSTLTSTGQFETRLRIGAFLLILVFTVILTRLAVYVYDPSPTLFDFELHHFDYGILLLLGGSKFLLFGPKKYYPLYLTVIAIASGLIIDDYWFIRRSLVEQEPDMLVYNATLPSVVILILGTILATLFINSLRRNRQR